MLRTIARGSGPAKGVIRNYSKSADELKCKVLVVGGGSGGCTVAAKLVSELGAGNVVILEPSNTHYYQPLFTLVGGGVCTMKQTSRKMEDVLPPKARWIQDKVLVFRPENNLVKTENGKSIKYDFLVVALGLSVDVNKVQGLEDALKQPDCPVSTNYLPQYAPKTFKCIKNFSGGTAVFTCPNTPIKCGGAPQKIAYLAEDYFTINNLRSKAKILYKTGQGVLFPAPHYEAPLYDVCKKRNITVSLNEDLVAIDLASKKATFRDTKTSAENDVEFSMLHVTPPQSAPPVLKTGSSFVDASGWLTVNKETLQHTKYENIFGIGDCTNLPTSKTAAAVAAQSKVVTSNLLSAKKKKSLDAKYDGYTSCPLVTGYNSLILAEFDYDKKPLETFPVDQRKESKILYRCKKDILPPVYWSLMLRGMWDGPGKLRRIFHPFS